MTEVDRLYQAAALKAKRVEGAESVDQLYVKAERQFKADEASSKNDQVRTFIVCRTEDDIDCEPNTLHSLNEAVEIARAGDKIQIRPGVYKLDCPVLLDKTLHINGPDQPGSSAIFEYKDVAFDIHFGTGHLSGLTVRPSSDDSGVFCGIRIIGGSWDVESCDISAVRKEGTYGVLLGPIDDEPLKSPASLFTSKIRNNRIHHCGHGIYIGRSSGQFFERNTIYNCAQAGITINSEKANLFVERNRAHHVAGPAIAVHERVCGSIEDNKWWDCASGLVLSPGCRAQEFNNKMVANPSEVVPQNPSSKKIVQVRRQRTWGLGLCATRMGACIGVVLKGVCQSHGGEEAEAAN